MPFQPYNALEAVGAFQQGRQMRTQREIGSALGGGNYAQAAEAAFRGGDLQTGMGLRQAMAQMNEQERSQAMQRAQTLAQIGQNLATQPYEQRVQILRSPVMQQQLTQMGFDPQQLASFDPTDANITAAIAPVMEIMRDTGPELTTFQRNLAAAGIDPNSEQGRAMAQQYAQRQAMGTPAASVNVNMAPQQQPRYSYGAAVGLPTGWRMNNETGQAERIPFGPAEAEAEAEREAEQRQGELRARNISTVTDEISRALDIISNRPSQFGRVSVVTRFDPEGPAAEVGRLYDTIGSFITRDTLQQMRDASPTGGALGNVSDAENAMLRAAQGSFDPSAPIETQVYNLVRLNNMVLDTVHGPGRGDGRLNYEEVMGRIRGRGGSSGGQPSRISSDAEYDALPSGAEYVGPDGIRRRKP